MKQTNREVLFIVLQQKDGGDLKNNHTGHPGKGNIPTWGIISLELQT